MAFEDLSTPGATNQPVEVTTSHPIYQAYLARWQFFWESFKGGSNYIASKKHLFQHRLESETDYNNRIKRAYYLNYCAAVVGDYIAHLLKAKYSVASENNDDIAFAEMQKDIDNRGTDVCAFRKQIFESAAIFGHVGILVDMLEEVNVQSMADFANRANVPYFAIYTPDTIIDWEIDRFGKFEWVKLQEIKPQNRNPQDHQAETLVEYQYRIFDRNSWTLENKDGDIIASGFHGIGEVPFVIAYWKRLNDMESVGLLSDISYINRAVFNYGSLLDEIVYRQTFSQMVYQSNSDKDVIGVGISQAIRYPEGTNAPSFISPDATQAEVLEKRIDKSIENIYRLAKLGGASGTKQETTAAASGVSKSYDFDQTNVELTSVAKSLNCAESHLWKLWLLWLNRNADEISCEYPESFDIKDISQLLAETKELLLVGKEKWGKIFGSKELSLQTAERIYEKMFSRMDEEEKATIYKEIEAGLKELDKQLEAPDGNLVNNNEGKDMENGQENGKEEDDGPAQGESDSARGGAK